MGGGSSGRISFYRANKLLREKKSVRTVGREANANRYREAEEVVGR